MKRVTIVSNDDSIIYTYTGSDSELKMDESSEYFTVHFNGCSTSYRKGKYTIKVERIEDEVKPKFDPLADAIDDLERGVTSAEEMGYVRFSINTKNARLILDEIKRLKNR